MPVRRDVDMLVDHMHQSVGGDEIQCDFGIFLDEGERDRDDVADAELDRHGDRQFAARRLIFARCPAFGFFQISYNAPRRFDIVAARVGQLDVAARPYEQVGS